MDFSEMQVRAHRDASRAAELGLTARGIEAMPWDEFNRLLGYDRPTPAEAARAALEAEHEQDSPAPAAPQSDPQAAESEPVGIDVNSPDFFHAWRSQRVSGGEGRGIFDSVSSQSDEYRSAAHRQVGRTGWANSNVVEPPRIGRAFIRHDDRIDQRSAGARFSNQSTMWQGR